jgi:hypothetical protein
MNLNPAITPRGPLAVLGDQRTSALNRLACRTPEGAGFGGLEAGEPKKCVQNCNRDGASFHSIRNLLG